MLLLHGSWFALMGLRLNEPRAYYATLGAGVSRGRTGGPRKSIFKHLFMDRRNTLNERLKKGLNCNEEQRYQVFLPEIKAEFIA
jgi:hypothetical protein